MIAQGWQCEAKTRMMTKQRQGQRHDLCFAKTLLSIFGSRGRGKSDDEDDC